ncbi:hypothetical protein XELAEV_18036056mg [Xenopus laevis]|uniref:Insulin-like domain-containing protein n=1 Tax=Xenopus laevis TaxID=8355 RepID=A0A974CHJ2_XENLA|nr:hypothetical protein XELAEV_18036056mg [Xenopus laevis]
MGFSLRQTPPEHQNLLPDGLRASTTIIHASDSHVSTGLQKAKKGKADKKESDTVPIQPDGAVPVSCVYTVRGSHQRSLSETTFKGAALWFRTGRHPAIYLWTYWVLRKGASFRNRNRPGIVEECCFCGCSVAILESYCAAPVTNFTGREEQKS